MIFRLTPFLMALWPLLMPAQPLLPQPPSPEASARAVVAPVPLGLRAAVDQALLHNLGIAVSRIDTGIAAESIEIAQASFDPVATAGTAWRRALAPEVSGLPANRAINDSWTNSLGVSQRFASGGTLSLNSSLGTGWVSPSGTSFTPDNNTSLGIEGRVPLLSGAGRTVNLAPIVQARQNLTKSQLNLRQAALDLLRDTEVAYWTLSASHALLALRESNLKSAEELLRQARARRQAGEATRQDELQAEAEVASQRVAIVNARESIANAEDNLRLLLSGMDVVETVPLAVSELPRTAPEAPNAFPLWISAVRSFDLDAQIRAIEIEQARLDMEVADNADQPSLELVAGAAVLGRDRHVDDAYAGMFNRSGYNLNAGLQLSIPLGFRESEARLRQARQRHDQARLRFASAQQQVMHTARAAHRALGTARDRLAATEATMVLRREAYSGEVAKYNLGDSTMSDVLQAKAALDMSELSNLQSLLDCVVAAARVARLDGDILVSLGFSWDEVDARVGTRPPVADHLVAFE